MRNSYTLLALQSICEYIKDCSNKSMIEIGCFAGESTEIWCKNFKKVYAIDPWALGKGYDLKDCASQNISDSIEQAFDQRLSKFNNFEKIKNFSYNAHSLFEAESVDFLYIDGEHTYNGVKKDIEMFLPKIKPDGFICGHDYKPTWQGVIDAVNENLGKPDKVFDDCSWIKKISNIK